jgi:hypothetical protein
LEAQELNPKGKFLQDTMKLAEPVQFSLSVKYDKLYTVLFPDSSFNYYPFEFISKKYFKTASDSLMSYDSTVYTLASYELENPQSLQLPVFMVMKSDSVTIFTQSDDIVFLETITEPVDSLQAVKSLTFVPLAPNFNYPYLIIGVGIVLVILIAITLVFGKKIMLRYKIYKLQQKHNRFLASFSDFSSLTDRVSLEYALSKWKGHAEYLTKKPYSKLTTKEISLMLKDEELNKNLQSIDKAIYSSKSQEAIVNNLEYLKSYTEVIFNNRIIELKDYARN